MQSNVFSTPRAVSTINAGRITYVNTAYSLLKSMQSIYPPEDVNILLEGTPTMLNGVLWYNTNYPKHLSISNLSSSSSSRGYFSTVGTDIVSVANLSVAENLLSESYFQPGEFVLAREEDSLYLVASNGNSIISIGRGSAAIETANNTTYFNGNNYSKFLKVDVDNYVTDTITLSNLSIGSATFSTSSSNANIYYLSNSIAFRSSEYSFANVIGGLRSSYFVQRSNTTASTTANLDLYFNTSFRISTTANTTISFSNVPPPGTGIAVDILYTNTGYFYLNWPTEVKWPNGIAPIPPKYSNTVSYTLITADGGANWYGIQTANNYV
jgi:hypothetical protein